MMNEHIERMVEEFDSTLIAQGLDKVEHHPVMCMKEKHTGELCGCEIAFIHEKQKLWLRTALTSAYNAGLENAYMLAMKTTCKENHIHEISCGFIPTNSLLAAIEKEKIEPSTE